ncbi:KdsC family phosphatase [Arcticibacter eurypsychrophilus]|uniref:KdsC family phosphatase n=1 Tax=Arcticibacter eurypsychrophilus TaxID=1434752 RepID=UPI00084D1854|nr:HAD family hydrolase [Arcticibacter eurypsychrophilus]
MFLTKIKAVKAFILDIDGILTDGTVLVTESGDQLRKFNVRDGYAMRLAVKRGFQICIISGGNSASVLFRLNGLGITEIHLGIDKKLEVYQQFIEKHNLAPENILYMGDDIPDIPVMKVVGVSACPEDAVEEVKMISDYISAQSGGTGCVRDVIEKVLKIQGKWYDPDPSAQDDTITSS